MSRVATGCHWPGWFLVVGGVCPVRWPKVMSAMVRFPSARWRDHKISSHRMRTARADCSPAVSPGIHRPRSWAAACSAWSLERLSSPSKRAQSRCPRPQGRGGPRRWAVRLASGVSARSHARPTSLGAALIRGLVRCSACGRVPVTCSGSMPGVAQVGVIALEVCLAWYREGGVLCMVASLVWADAWCPRYWDRVGVTHA